MLSNRNSLTRGSTLEQNILPLKQREEVTDRWLLKRLERVLPSIMRDSGVDMWIIIGREYNEDPILKTLLPTCMHTAGRLTIIIFSLNQDNSVSRYRIGAPHSGLDDLYSSPWNIKNENQWECLQRIVNRKSPETIGVNYSKNYALSDGLTNSYYDQICATLGSIYAKKIISAEHLVIRWLETRISEEINAYPSIAELARSIVSEALSNKVIHPGVTTTKDVVYWLRQRVSDLGIKISFYPTVDLQRRGASVDRLADEVILPGDIVHVDFGIEYLGLSTDTQQLAYVLNMGETDAPEGLKAALRRAIRLEDIIEENFMENRTGNEVFSKALHQAKSENIKAMIYSHPLGFHCHGAGPIIGLYDKQEEVPINGEYKVHNYTCYAMEFNIREYIPEWDQEVPISLNNLLLLLMGRCIT